MRSTASPISPHDADPSTNDARPTDDSRAPVARKNVRDAVERIPTTMIRKIEAVAEAGREVRRLRAEALDTAVLNAYGFSAKKDLLAQLPFLNGQVAERIEKGDPVTAPSMPNYLDAKKRVTEDCI
jgi:hypothetical protein